MIRKIERSQNGEIVIKLPEEYLGRLLEIFVLPIEKNVNKDLNTRDEIDESVKYSQALFVK